jgi:hypothetical protein
LPIFLLSAFFELSGSLRFGRHFLSRAITFLLAGSIRTVSPDKSFEDTLRSEFCVGRDGTSDLPHRSIQEQVLYPKELQ